MNGILLALQFFTVLPIKKELPLSRKSVTAMYCVLPFIGGGIGAVMYGVYQLAADVFQFGPLLTAVLIVITGIGLTGGLHADGWADTADAFFSYRTKEKRFEILADPRLGAFGTMALVLLIVMKIALMHEVIVSALGEIYLFMLIPFLARAAMNIYFTTLKPAKESGIANFFHEKLAVKNVLMTMIISSITVLAAYSLWTGKLFLLVFIGGMLVLAIVYFRRWSMKHFSGVTGDLAGAFIEGTEAILWLIVLCLL